MRPITNFTLHAILAAALTAFAATSAAAGKFDAYLELGSIRGETEAHKDRKGEQIELLSYSFGEAKSVSKVDSFTMKQGIKPVSEANSPAQLGSWSKASGLDVKWDVAEYRHGDAGNASNTGANEKLAVGADRTETAQATGKRTHKPLRMRMVYDAGSVTIGGRFTACRVGASYHSAAIGLGNRRYELSDVVVASCGAEGMSLNFAKVKVRGWDPEKKEE